MHVAVMLSMQAAKVRQRTWGTLLAVPIRNVDKVMEVIDNKRMRAA